MKVINGADILKMGELMGNLKRMVNSRRVTLSAEVILGGIRFDPGTYEITRVDPPAETETPF